MRQIKFRGLYKNTWVYGSLVQVTVGDKKTTMVENADFNDHRVYEVDHKTVGQFTGLLDKNGKEIYEGDILSQDPFLKVVFENGGFCFSNDLLSGSDRLSQERVGRLEIIGNIHETL